MDSKALDGIKRHLRAELEELSTRGKRTVFEISRELSNEADFIDRASHESLLAEVTRLRSRERRLIDKIKRALKAIDDGDYGICESCGADIAIRRLQARPVTTLCIHCKERMEDYEKRIGA